MTKDVRKLRTEQMDKMIVFKQNVYLDETLAAQLFGVINAYEDPTALHCTCSKIKKDLCERYADQLETIKNAFVRDIDYHMNCGVPDEYAELI